MGRPASAKIEDLRKFEVVLIDYLHFLGREMERAPLSSRERDEIRNLFGVAETSLVEANAIIQRAKNWESEQ